ncbi:MAG: hypothetical protein E5Y88_09700 [Mesorhizobium sp.]|uniref:Uncharacterized protein n=1 Tax=Mesorhizobium mediterraneum TaxID=43617 RepID=A0AB36R136_9HYPH|nr:MULTISPECIES: hypothetical protein [Mesorhizobium]RUU16542.1 hypothetical protein EOD08_28210 [Mesorhizobium sp. M6A.T.Ca.TU.002.02.2.1]PAP98393.1 hypothetical protein CIT25_32185 [Mesorhizobium mediterraneum]RUU27975.1 hypothetical protein EOC94_20585 [Mesorhizobium sp. M6A.T.Ce.TU.016.01.1.1]RUU40840.1 hypothetical protein EOC93_20590 [Mesorhizobium sp. M6A.T.Ce.TU.002.03.1.1]RUV02067.1 hypothetical protein EOB36_11160 [Mesorhizobium sp. M6A.T.Cr.TU.017.01.1.1]
MKHRFEAIPNPSCRFEIWDNENDEPVVHHDRLLTFASAKLAARIADFLNEGRSHRRRAGAAKWRVADRDVDRGG